MATVRGWLLAALVGSLLVTVAPVNIGDAPVGATSPPAEANRAAAGGLLGVPTARHHSPASFRDAVLTPQGFDRYRYDAAQNRVVVSAPQSNRGANLRSVWWSNDDPPVVDAQSCVTWSSFDGPLVQAGIALRVRQEGDRTVALTVTNNVWAGARAGWNVHAWSGDWETSRLLGQALLTEAFGESVFQEPPLPWRICARTVGATLEFKAWSLREHADVAWGDPRYGTAILLPDDVVRAGRAGWYVGHLGGGDRSTFTSLDARPLSLSGLDALTVRERAAAGCVARVTALAASPWVQTRPAGCGQVAPGNVVTPG